MKVLEAVAGTLLSAKSRVYALRNFRAYLYSIAARKPFLQLLSIVAVVASASLVAVMALILDERNTLTLMVFGWSWRDIALMNALHSGLTAAGVFSIVTTLFALMGYPLTELATLEASCSSQC